MGEISEGVFYTVTAVLAILAALIFFLGPRVFKKALTKLDEGENPETELPSLPEKTKAPPQRMWEDD
ncbi:MAG: hypothetical protein MUC92_02655 [Fimbriimonadaceae bacterium]|jgi:hypothetical protein|nr:hypothetical protein [Fimbriimonadaceae bacterium]